ncbi:TetR/AcrR family transcriptional regulator [Paenibacillus polymyxa]|uniref:TetR/AcrR family transcriptional regulator n=1 Tax=Paenibacillus polymyxa TaxID=1406 RepID=UPI002349E36E|nr:TetR/AcrR family transcriptional regulator [Paenibacillus polymyxa]WCM60741.1 TetR/AcrR family transcriptional regulator [Paenibacillus polymyxa]
MENKEKQYTSRELQALNTKKKLFQAALQLMKNKGYDNFTVREVCKIAGTSTGNFYNYFNSKEQILSYYYEMAGNDFEVYLRAHDTDQNPIEKMVSFYVWYARYTADFGLDFCRAFFSSNNKSLNTDKIYNRIMEITFAFVQEAANEGFLYLDGRTCEEITKDMCVVVKGAIMDWCVYDGGYDLPQYVQRLLTNCIKGILYPVKLDV